MRPEQSRIVSLVRSVPCAALVAVFLVGNICAAEQSPARDRGYAAKAHQSLHLHTAPNYHASAQGLRETAPEEVQRIEELGARQKFTRHDQLNEALGSGCLEPTAGNRAIKPLLLIEAACSRANLIAFAHAFLTSRYPIPPPRPLHS